MFPGKSWEERFKEEEMVSGKHRLRDLLLALASYVRLAKYSPSLSLTFILHKRHTLIVTVS